MTNKDIMDIVKKIGGGLIIAAVSGSVAWSISTSSRVVVNEERLNSHYTDILQTQDRIQTNTVRLDAVEDKVLTIFNEMVYPERTSADFERNDNSDARSN